MRRKTESTRVDSGGQQNCSRRSFTVRHNTPAYPTPAQLCAVIMNSTSHTFHDAECGPVPSRMIVSSSTIDWIVNYTGDISNITSVVFSDYTDKMWLALKEKGFSDTRPRFPNVTAVVVHGDIDDDDFGVIHMLVNVKNVCAVATVQVTQPLRLLARFVVAGAPISKIRLVLDDNCKTDTGSIPCCKKVYIHKGVTELTIGMNDDVDTLIIGGGSTTADDLVAVFKKFPLLRKLRMGTRNPPRSIRIADPALYRVLLLGGQAGIYMSSMDQQLECIKDITVIGATAMEGFLYRAEPVPEGVQVSHHSILLAVLRSERGMSLCDRRTHYNHASVAQPAILSEVPTSAKVNTPTWTVMRATALVYMSVMKWDKQETYQLLLHMWASCCCYRAATCADFARAAVQSIMGILACATELAENDRGSIGPGLYFITEYVEPFCLREIMPESTRQRMESLIQEVKVFVKPRGFELNLDACRSCMLHKECDVWN